MAVFDGLCGGCHPFWGKAFVISGKFPSHSDFLNRIQGKIKGKNLACPAGALFSGKVVSLGD
jgi:hypothetical protein